MSPEERPVRPVPDARAEGGRIGGVDAARALAIVGMVMVHFGPTGADGEGILARVYGVTHGRASILFVLLAGLGVSLMAGDRSRARRRRTWAHLGFRAALLLPFGLALQLLDHGVLVILQYYAVYFLVAAAAMRLGDRALLAGAVGTAALAPVVYLAVWTRRLGWVEADAAVLTDPPGFVLRDLLLTGSYPVITWSAPLLFGMWIGRRGLRDGTVRWRMVAGGTACAVGALAASRGLERLFGAAPDDEPSWLLLTVQEGHSQMPLWLIGATGAATAVLGLSLLAVDRWSRVTWPLAAAGQLALTIYVGHLLLLHSWPTLVQRDEVVPAAVSVALFTAVVSLAAVAWRRSFSRGPLEAAMRLPSAPERR